jgi:hypothetical protein
MVNILERPIFPPYQCIVCGVGDPRQRKWFVDTQINLDNIFNPQNHGSIYLCNECWDSLALSVARDAQVFVLGQVPWENGDYVEPTYDNEEELVTDGLRLPEPGVSDSVVSDVSDEPDGDDSDSEGGDSDTDADSDDDEPDPVSNFRGLFGKD